MISYSLPSTETNLAALQASPGRYVGEARQTLGYSTPGDRGDGLFVWSGSTWDRILDASVKVSWFGAKGKYRQAGDDTDDTAACQAAINLAVSLLSGGKIGGLDVVFGPGTFGVSALDIPAGTKGLTLRGAHKSYSDTAGTTIRAISSGPYLLRMTAPSTDLHIHGVNLDGQCLKDSVVLFNHVANQILDMIDVKDCFLFNPKDGGCLVGSTVAGGVGGENALVTFDNVTFALNSSVNTAARGSSIRMLNQGAWGWLAEKCKFFGDSGAYGSVNLEAGELTMRDCEFENNSVQDVILYGSAKLVALNCHSQDFSGTSKFFDIRAKQINGLLWSDRAIKIQDCQHYCGGAHAQVSVSDASASPIIIENFEGYGADISYVGIKFREILNSFHGYPVSIQGTTTPAASNISQVTNGNDIQRLYSTDGLSWLGVNYGGDPDTFAIDAYRAGGGYIALLLAASVLKIPFGPIEMKKLTSLGTAPANTLRFACRDNGSGKMQLVAQFPSGALQIIATEP